MNSHEIAALSDEEVERALEKAQELVAMYDRLIGRKLSEVENWRAAQATALNRRRTLTAETIRRRQASR